MGSREARLAVLLAAGACLALAGCGGNGEDEDSPAHGADGGASPGAGVQARFDPRLAPAGSSAAERWLAFPFPADHRRTAAGTIRLSDFPNPGQVGLVSSYVQLAESELDGFSANGAAYVAFDGPLDPRTIPSDPPALARPDSPVQIVDVTEGSPERGRRRPLRWEWRPAAGRYVAANTLAVAPAWGFPLRERTTYALLVTRAVRGADGRPLRAPALLSALLSDSPSPPDPSQAGVFFDLHAQYAPLRAQLARDALAPEQIAVASVFTVQSITAQLAAVRRQLTEELPAPANADRWVPPEGAAPPARHVIRSFTWRSGQSVEYAVMEGAFDSWNYQVGEVPYLFAGGQLHFQDGLPAPVRVEPLRFVLTLPRAPPRAGECYPLVQVAHGTGGNAYSFTRDGTAGRLAARGLAGISIDQPLHGPRAMGRTFDVGLMTFNWLNAASARASFRQSAIDTFVLTRFARESLRVPAGRSPSGEEVCFDPDRVGFFGHSQGGISGALAAAYERGVTAWMLSGAGGGLAITAMERKDVMDIAQTFSLLLGLDASEPLTELHPALTLVQTLTDVTDPVNYAPYWSELETYGPAQSVLATSGLHDEATPYRTATAMAVAGGIPNVAPVVVPAPQFDWAGLPPAQAPVRRNRNGATAGFLQFRDDVATPEADTHFLVFYRPEAIHASMRFLESAAFEEAPVIERVPDADVR